MVVSLKIGMSPRTCPSATVLEDDPAEAHLSKELLDSVHSPIGDLRIEIRAEWRLDKPQQNRALPASLPASTTCRSHKQHQKRGI